MYPWRRCCAVAAIRTIKGMRTTPKHFIHRMLILAVGISILTAACGKDTEKTATTAKPTATANAAAESPYCDAAREWAVAELTPFDDSDPAAFRAHWDAFVAFIDKGTQLSPAPIHDDWAVYGAVIAKQTPVLERFGYDKGRFEEQATPEEKALFEDPGPEAGKAFATVLNYEALTCATAQPPAAEVDFSDEKPAQAYCEAAGADNEMMGEVVGNGFTPEDFRALVTSKDYQAVTKKERDAAPAVIKDDAEALYTFLQEEQLPLVAKRGYDVRKIILDGPHADREILQGTAGAVRDSSARLAAYEEQVCGAE